MSRDPRVLEECRALCRAVSRFPTLEALHAAPEWPDLERRLGAVLGAVRRFSPGVAPAPPRDPTQVRLVQWNIEHGNWYEQVERALREHESLAGADIVTLDEVDLGTARAANRDVAFDLAAALGLHATWAPLFLETTLGRDDDVRMAAGRENQEGLFGLAVLSRWPLGEVRLLELPSPERMQFELERMVGRHAALIVEVLRPGAPFVVVAAHLEVHHTRAHRAAQMRAIMNALRDEQRPIVIAGDFNTHTFDRGLWHTPLWGAVALMLFPAQALRTRLLYPDRGLAREWLFDELRRGGFAWESYVDFEPTLYLRYERLEEVQFLPGRLHAVAERVVGGAVRRGALRLDWIAGRNWNAGRGFTVQGLDGAGLASDHAPIVAELR